MSNLTINEFKMLARGRNTGGYQNISREQLEDLLVTLKSKPTP